MLRDGAKLGRDDILAYAAQFPEGDELYKGDPDQVRPLKDNQERVIGVGIRPSDGGGIVCFWFADQKVTVTHPDVTCKAQLLQLVFGWTEPWPVSSKGVGKGKGKGKQTGMKKRCVPDDLPPLESLKARKF